MNITIIDNYDSFTYNLVQLVGSLTANVVVFRNDKVVLGEIIASSPNKIIISPGPGHPKDSNVSLDVIKILGKTIPLLGVCLGHQAIGYCFGANVTNSPTLMHGKSSKIFHDGKSFYHNLQNGFEAARYHSLVVSPTGLPNQLEISAQCQDKTIMGIRHKHYPIEGIQFHPESVLTKSGYQLIKNWIEL